MIKRSHFWMCTAFLLLGILIGLASVMITYRYRSAFLRLSNRALTTVVHITKSMPIVASTSQAASSEGPLALTSFESDKDLKLFEDSTVPVERTTKHTTQGEYSLKATFPSGGGAIGTWSTLPRDWSGYEWLRFDVYSEDQDVPLSLLIKDPKHISYGERYNKERIKLRKGWNSIDIPLADVSRKINLRDIVQVRIFLYRVPGKHILFFDNFRLERGSQATAEKPPTQTSPPVAATKPTVNVKGSLTLASFESDRDLRVFSDSSVPIARTTEHTTQGQFSLKATFPSGGGAIGTWRTLPRDWSGYERLQFDVYSMDDNLPLSLFIKDSKHIAYGERYNEERIKLRTGWNSIDIPLSDVARKINLRDIVQVRIFLHRVPGQHILFFDNFRLKQGELAAKKETLPPASPTIETERKNGMRVWVVGESYKIRPDHGTPFNPSVKRELRYQNELWDASKKLVYLQGAKNEYVGFQIIIEAANQPLEQVTIVQTDLVGPSTIASNQIKFFREHYINVTMPSSWPQPSTGPGEYPDPLVPLDLHETDNSFDVPARRNQAIWVDIYIPESTPAGLYAGIISVDGKGMKPAYLTVQLQVWDFTLPRESHLTFWSGYYDLDKSKGYGVRKDSPEHRKVERELWRLSHQHRISALLQYIDARPKYTGSGSNIKVDWTSYDRRVGPYLDGTFFEDRAKPNYFILPIFYFVGNQWPDGDDETFLQMGKELARHFDDKGWDLSKTLIYLGDEPKKKEFPIVKRLARLVRQADSRFKTTVAFISFSPEILQEFAGLIDLWMLDAQVYSSKLLAPRKAKGELVGFYQQSEPFLGNETLDADGLALRTWPWIAWKYKVDVIHLYSMTEWWRGWQNGRDPWKNPLNWNDSNNQGIIIYPGYHIKNKRVIGSIRMKQIRRGMQDYEYLYLAKAAGTDTAPVVNAIIRQALDETRRGWGSPGAWERDPAKWLEARRKLAALILQSKGSQPKVTTNAKPATFTSLAIEEPLRALKPLRAKSP